MPYDPLREHEALAEELPVGFLPIGLLGAALDQRPQAAALRPGQGRQAAEVEEFRKRMENDGMALLDVGYADYKAFIDEQARAYVEAAMEAGVIK